jgi:hypothetical protein
MSNTTQQIVNKAWNFAHVLRDDGLSYMPIRIGKAQQVLSSAIILGDHQLASWLDLAVKTDRVVGTPEALKELRERLDSVMQPLPEETPPPIWLA